VKEAVSRPWVALFFFLVGCVSTAHRPDQSSELRDAGNASPPALTGPWKRPVVHEDAGTGGYGLYRLLDPDAEAIRTRRYFLLERDGGVAKGF
jgi:hypothetical protein